MARTRRASRSRATPLTGEAIKSKDVASFIFDHLLPQLMDRQRFRGPRKKYKILDLVDALEPDQFFGLVLLYALRIEDRDGVSRAYDILLAPSSFYLQRLGAYRNSREGGRTKANLSRAKLAKRNQRILERANTLLEEGKQRRNIAGILAKENELTSTTIRMILRNSKMW